MADTVRRRECRILDLLHAQPLRPIGQIGALGVQDRVVIAAAQLQRHFAGDGARHPALGGFAHHQGLRIEPPPLVKQPAKAHAADPVLLDGVLVVDAGDQTFVGDVQQRHAGRFVDAAALGLDDAILDLVAHAEAVPATDGIGLEEQRNGIGEGLAVQRNRLAFLKAHDDLFGLDDTVVAPERHTHERIDDLDAAVELLKILGLVGGAEEIAVGRVGLFSAHLVGESIGAHERRHFRAAAQFVDEQLVEPGLVDPQARIGQQAVAVEPLDIVAFVGGAVAPDVDAVLLHGSDQHRAGHGAAERGGVEVGDAAGRDMEGAGLDGGDTFVNQLRAAIHQPGFFAAELERLARNLVVVGFVRLAEIGGIGKDARALLLHPEQRRAGVETARESDADFFPLGQAFQNRTHGASNRSK